MIKKVLLCSGILILLIGSYRMVFYANPNPFLATGTPIDSLDQVKVYYNGGVNQVRKRRIMDGYNIGLEFQCVEFVKRFYYLKFHHKMPDSYGHAKSFYNKSIPDASYNAQRGLLQYANPSIKKPSVYALVVFDASWTNTYGHVAIISAVHENTIEIIQQNPGPFASSRVTYPLEKRTDGTWYINGDRILGWLERK